MPDNVMVPIHESSDVTVSADGAITGCTFVAVSGREGGIDNNYIGSTCAAEAKPFGVARYDIADGESAGVVGTPGRIVTVKAGGTVAAGAQIEVGADGKAVTLDAGVPAGIALTGGAANALIEVKLV